MDAKTLRQQTGVDKWLRNRGIGGLQWWTAVGKTYTALNIIIPRYLKKYEEVVLILVPTYALKKKWNTEVKEAKLTNRVLVRTGDEMINNEEILNVGLVIIDEASAFLTPARRRLWNGELIKTNFLAWLDAELNPEKPFAKEFLSLYPVCDKISEKEAQALGFITKSLIVNYGIELPSDDLAEYEELANNITELINSFGTRGLQAAVECLSGKSIQNSSGGYVYVTSDNCALEVAKSLGYTYNISDLIYREKNDKERARLQLIEANCNPQALKGRASNVMELIRQRVYFLYRHKLKIKVVKELVKALGMKTLVFSESRDFIKALTIELIGEGQKVVSFYSDREATPMCKGVTGEISFFPIEDEFIKTKTGKNKDEIKKFGTKSLNDAALRDFELGLADILVSGSGLNRGYDNSKIQLVINASGTSSKENFNQKKGRGQRLDSDNLNKIAINICVYFINTVDNYWLQKSQKSTSSKIVNTTYRQTSPIHINAFIDENMGQSTEPRRNIFRRVDKPSS